MPGRALALALAVAFPLALAGCLTATTVEVSAVPDVAAGSNATVGAYLHDLSEVAEGVTVLGSILEQYRIPAPDGTLLDTWIVRPDVEGPVPLVLEVTPYHYGGAIVDPLLGTHDLGNVGDELVPRGYAVGISSVRGTGLSEGCFTQGGPAEAKDTAAVIEHLASQPWSNGNVGLIGVSYPGTTPQDVWVEAPPALKTIVPISGISDLYKYNFVNGVPINVQGFGFNTYYWALVGAAPASPLGSSGVAAKDPASVPGAVAGEACADQVDVQEGGVSSTLDGNKDAYWQARDFLAELEAAERKPTASVLYVHGLQDWNVKPHNMEDWLPAVQASGVPYKVWLGQWGHAWPDRADWWNQTMVAWFDQFLKGVDTGILDAPAVQVMSDDEKWRHEAVWPPVDVDLRELFPAADGTLGVGPGEGEVSYDDERGRIVCESAMQCAAADASGALFVSEPFAADAQLSGLPRYEGTVTASGARASLVLTLAELLPDGTMRPFNYAALSLNHVESLEAGKDDVSGLAQRVVVDFFPQDDVVHAGSRLVLWAAGNTMPGGPGPALQPISTGSTITLDLADAKLTLPIDTTLVYEEPQPEPAE